jgi:hypothetical protein
MKRRNKYRKHIVRVGESYMTVKDWMRENPGEFTHISGTPTSFQIGGVLVKLGYGKREEHLMVIYS